MIVAYKECQDCIYYSPIDKFYCHCSARDKKYHYGQWVPCEDKKPLDVTLPIEVEEVVPIESLEVEKTVVETNKRAKRTRKKKGE